MARLSRHQRQALEDLAKEIKPGIGIDDPLGWCVLPSMPPQTRRWLRRGGLIATVRVYTTFTHVDGHDGHDGGNVVIRRCSWRHRLTARGACVLASDRKNYR